MLKDIFSTFTLILISPSLSAKLGISLCAYLSFTVAPPLKAFHSIIPAVSLTTICDPPTTVHGVASSIVSKKKPPEQPSSPSACINPSTVTLPCDDNTASTVKSISGIPKNASIEKDFNAPNSLSTASTVKIFIVIIFASTVNVFSS